MMQSFCLRAGRRCRTRVMAMLCAGILLPGALWAQELPSVPPVSEILTLLASPDAEDRNTGQRWILRFLDDEPEPLGVERLVDGLTLLAITHPDLRVRGQAITALFKWAQDTVERDPRWVVQVLEGIYNEVPDAAHKAWITRRMPELGPQGGMIAFLRRVAVSDETPWDAIPAIAIEGLASLGEPGRAVLRELHAQDAVPVQRARWRLEDLARQDFRIGG